MWMWSFNFSNRHCWPLIDGRYRIDGSWGEDSDSFCNEWKNHPLKAGPSEYLRWIRNFARLAPGTVTDFEDGWLKLGKIKMPDREIVAFCENYGNKVQAFLDNPEAIVFILDESLESAAEEAVIQTEQEYIDMIRSCNG